MSDIKIIDSKAAKVLRDFVSRIENLEREKTGIGEDIKEVYNQVKQAGLDVPTVRLIIKRRQKSEQELQEAEYLLDAYETALEEKAQQVTAEPVDEDESEAQVDAEAEAETA